MTQTHGEECVVGYCDGLKGGEVYGWAWRPDQPDRPVTVELWLDGVLAGEAVAALYRPDIRAAGIGHGRYGWRLPVPPPQDGAEPLGIVVRAKDGEPLTHGTFEVGAEVPAGEIETAQFEAFVAAALGRGPPRQGGAEALDTQPRVHFLLHCPGDAAALGAAEYSYGFVRRAFEPLLRRFGAVHIVDDPLAQADAIHAEALARGETSVLFSFAPPQRTILGLRCPVLPVIAWEFPTIPDRVWDGDRRHDWRFVLRQTGRVLTLSGFAAEAVRASMGADFPVAAVPAPIYDRFPDHHALGPPPVDGTTIHVDGFILDSRGREFPLREAIPPPPVKAGEEATQDAPGASAVIDGVVFTAVVAPKDGRKNWPDLITAFLAAHGANADATLVMKMIAPDPAVWWWEFHELLGRAPPFVCRILVLQGYMADASYGALIIATHWIVNASRAEGLCLPLLEFMSAGRPAIAPRHTAMADYITPSLALVVESEEEYCGWPHDPLNVMTTTRHRIAWPSLVAAFSEGRRITTTHPQRYAAMSAAARSAMEAFCGDIAVSAKLDAFLGLGWGLSVPAAIPSSLFADAAA